MTNTTPQKQIKCIRIIPSKRRNKYESMFDVSNRGSVRHQIECEDGSTEDVEIGDHESLLDYLRPGYTPRKIMENEK